MGYEGSVNEPKVMKCPFCDKGEVHAVFTPARVERKVSRGSGINKTTPTWIDERYMVEKGCPNCGKTGEQIEKLLNRGGEEPKPPAREEILRRMREAGLDTTLKKKLKED